MTQISKTEWERLGGLRNPDLCRIMRGGRWRYYKGVTR
jgi:hypothetical protein